MAGPLPEEPGADGAGRPSDLPALPDGVVVPDDPRALDADRAAYVAELAARSRAARRRPRPIAPWRGSGALLFAVLSVAAVMAALMVVVIPRPNLPVPPRPLATVAGVDSEVGGLLPDTTVSVGGQSRPLRSLRPVVLAIVPSGTCTGDCRGGLIDVTSQAVLNGVRLVVAGPAAQGDALRDLSRVVTGGLPTVLDSTGALTSMTPTADTSTSSATYVLVRADGVVAAILRGSTVDGRVDAATLDATLRALPSSSGAPTG